MQVRELLVPGAFEFTPVQHGDDRGLFLEWFKIETAGRGDRSPADARPGQPVGVPGRHSARRALRGRSARPGQVRHLPARRGARLHRRHPGRFTDFRRRWTSVRLDGEHRRAVYLPEGVGHAFVALEDHSTLTYLCSTGLRPRPRTRHHAARSRRWTCRCPDGVDFLLSDKDAAAPTLAAGGASPACCPTWDGVPDVRRVPGLTVPSRRQWSGRVQSARARWR